LLKPPVRFMTFKWICILNDIIWILWILASNI
jgi:hypothetical protein